MTVNNVYLFHVLYVFTLTLDIGKARMTLTIHWVEESVNQMLEVRCT